MMARRIQLALLCVFACGCGGDGAPAAPTVPARPGWAVGTVLTVVSAADGVPVAGATVLTGERTVTADAAGHATLDTFAPDATLLDVLAPGFLDRQTLVRSSEGLRITLWPKETAIGLTEHTTAELVYTPGASCCPADQLAGQGLRRVAPTIPAFTLVLAPEYRDYPQSVAAIQEAAALASAVSGGRVRFSLGESATGPRIDIVAGPDPLGRPNVAALAARSFDANGYINGGRIIAVRQEFLTEGWSHVDTVALMAHELGHMLGLEHSTAVGVMANGDESYHHFRREGDYSPVEKQVLGLMSARRALTRFPDNDRQAAATTQAGDLLVCLR